MTVVPVLSPQEIADAMKNLPGWELDGDSMKKTFKFDHYLAGIAFAGAVGTLAEAQNHHPNILISWRRVTVSVNTHEVGNKITHKDTELAAAIENLGYPRKAE